jgi:hypothetical protein
MNAESYNGSRHRPTNIIEFTDAAVIFREPNDHVILRYRKSYARANAELS